MACFRLPDKQQAHKQLHTSYIFILTKLLSFFRLIHFNLSLCLSSPCHRRSLSLQSNAASHVLSSQLFVPCSLLALAVCYTTEADSTTFDSHSSWSDSSVSGESNFYCCICAILIYIVSSMKVVDLGFSSWYFLSNNGCYQWLYILRKCYINSHNQMQTSQQLTELYLTNSLRACTTVTTYARPCFEVETHITSCGNQMCSIILHNWMRRHSHKYRCLQQVYLSV